MTGRATYVQRGNIDIVPIAIVISVRLVDIVTKEHNIRWVTQSVQNALVVDIIPLDKHVIGTRLVQRVTHVDLGNTSHIQDRQLATIVHPVSLVVVVVALVGIEYKMSINRT